MAGWIGKLHFFIYRKFITLGNLFVKIREIVISFFVIINSLITSYVEKSEELL